MPIYMTAQYQIKPHAVEPCKQVVRELIDHVRKNEPGLTLYLAQQEILNPTRFLHVLRFENEAALTIHQNSRASERFVNTVYPETLRPVEFIEYNLIASRQQE